MAARCTAPLTYQWRLNGGNIGGATKCDVDADFSNDRVNLAGFVLRQQHRGFRYECGGDFDGQSRTCGPNDHGAAGQPNRDCGNECQFQCGGQRHAPLSYQWRLNGGNIVGATSATLTLTGVTTGQAGNYSCVVSNSAGDSAASAAATLTVNAVMAQPSKLTVTVQGQGTVYPNLNGSELTIGKVYTLNAMPAAGYSFSGWLQSAQQLSASATISFVMTSNLVLSATFIPDPMVAVAGTYNGLFYRRTPSGSRRGRSIFARTRRATFRVGADRLLTLSILRQTRRQYAGDQWVTRWDGTPLTVQFTIGQDATAGQITGSVTDGVWSAPLSGGRSVANSPFAGEYTVVIPGTSAMPRCRRVMVTPRCMWRRMV